MFRAVQAGVEEEHPRLIRDRLRRRFGVPDAPPRRPPLDELILTILSQNTSDRNRDRAYEALAVRYQRWEDVLAGSVDELESVISPAGLGHTKSRRIWNILEGIYVDGGEDINDLCRLPPEIARERLTSLKGVGPKTAACVLMFSCGTPTFPVDTHIFRVCRRLGFLPPGADRIRAHDILEKRFDAADYMEVHLNIIQLGRKICRPKKPSCPGCPLMDLCPSAKMMRDDDGNQRTENEDDPRRR